MARPIRSIYPTTVYDQKLRALTQAFGEMQRALVELTACFEAERAREHSPSGSAYMTIKQACAEAAVGRSKLYSLIAAGRLEARWLGDRRVIARADLERFMRELPAEREEAFG